MARLEGVGSPTSSRGRERLSVRDPEIEKLLAGLAIDDEDLAQIRRFGKALWRARNVWSIDRAARRHEELNALGAFRPSFGRRA